MTITCPKCKARLALPDEKLKAGATKFKCSKCGTSLLYKGKGEGKAEDSSSETAKTISPRTPQPTVAPKSPGRFKAGKDIPAPGIKSPADLKSSGDTGSSTASASSPRPDKQPENQKKAATDHDALTQLSPPPEERKGVPMRMLLAGASGLVILLLAAIFFFRPADRAPQQQAQKPAKATVTADARSPGEGPVSQEIGGENAPSGSAREDASPEQPLRTVPPSEMNEEKAIDMVKKSDALLKNTPVDEIIRAWTTQNAAQYNVVGWKAKQVDAGKYLVSYTALDGNLTKGFYFDLDVETGVVQDLAHNPELQKKYNIQYGN
jgi:predicted Zn finger-like uncharacterized protein